MKQWLVSLPDWLRRSIRTFLWAFLALFATSLVGWLNDVQEWASCVSECAEFPSPTVLAKAAVAAASSAIIAAFNALIALGEDKGVIPALLKAPASSGTDPVPHPR